MPESTTLKFDYTEVVEALIRKQGLHEGIWQFGVEFALGASLIPRSSQSNEVLPTALAGIGKIVLTKVDKENNLTVDAGKVNPVSK